MSPPIMRRFVSLLAASALVLGVAPRRAEACGGYFPPTPPAGQAVSVATDHRVVVAIQDSMVTVWDQVEYSGDPSEFAWVMPIRGRVAVGVGSDDFFQQLDDKSALKVYAPARYCPKAGCGGGTGCASSADSAEPGGGDTGIVVLDRSVVGPYEQVQIRGSSEKVILDWLRANKFEVPVGLEPTFKKYFDEGHDFLSVRLRPKVGVRAMRPIRVSWKRKAGEAVKIPLRMAAAGISDSVGIKLMLVSDKRYKPENYPTYAIDPAQLTWNFDTQKSDYVDVRAKGAEPFKGRAFALESSAELSVDLLGKIASGATLDAGELDTGPLDTGPLDTGPLDTGALDADATDGASLDGSSDGATDAPTDAPTADTTDAASEGAAADSAVDAGEPPTVDPSATDVELAYGTYTVRRVTRFYGKIPAAYLDQDLTLTLDPVQTALDRMLVADKTTGTPVCGGATIAGDSRTAVLDLGWLVGIAAAGIVLARRAHRR